MSSCRRGGHGSAWPPHRDPACCVFCSLLSLGRAGIALGLRLKLARLRGGLRGASANGHALVSADLAAVAQELIGDDAGHHGLADRHGANADAGVVAALGHDVDVMARHCRRVRRGLRIEDVGFTAKRATTGWPVEMPPRMPPAWLDRNSGRPSLPMRISSAFSSPVSAAAREAVADLDALDRVDAHQRGGEVGIELAVDRRARARPGRPRRQSR